MCRFADTDNRDFQRVAGVIRRFCTVDSETASSSVNQEAQASRRIIRGVLSEHSKETPSVKYSTSSTRADSKTKELYSICDGWTELSKDLVSREALDSASEDYQDTGRFLRISRVMSRAEVYHYAKRSEHQVSQNTMPTYGRNVNMFFDVPLTNNPFFTGRQYHLSKLDEMMYPFTPSLSITSQLRCSLLVGLGGCGKTEIAVRYAHIHRKEFFAVLWIDGTSRNSFLESFLRIARNLQTEVWDSWPTSPTSPTSRTRPIRPTSPTSPTSPTRMRGSSVNLIADMEGMLAADLYRGKDTLPRMINWMNSLHHRHDWLMVIDNMDDPSMVVVVEDFLAKLNKGFVLITTRNSRASRLGPSMDVGDFTEEEATEFLLRSVKLWEQPLSCNPNRTQADSLCQSLGCLALAIDQAAAYINENGLTLEEYLELFQQEKAYLLGTTSHDRYARTRSADLDKKYDTVLLTWEISFQFIEKENPASALLLQLLAFMDHEGISEDLFQAIYISKGQWEDWSSMGTIVKSNDGESELAKLLIQGMDSKPKFHEVVGKLLAFSLVKRTANRRRLSVHPVRFSPLPSDGTQTET